VPSPSGGPSARPLLDKLGVKPGFRIAVVGMEDEGFLAELRWSIEMAGERPSMKSTSGFSICPRNCRA